MKRKKIFLLQYLRCMCVFFFFNTKVISNFNAFVQCKEVENTHMTDSSFLLANISKTLNQKLFHISVNFLHQHLFFIFRTLMSFLSFFKTLYAIFRENSHEFLSKLFQISHEFFFFQIFIAHSASYFFNKDVLSEIHALRLLLTGQFES